MVSSIQSLPSDVVNLMAAGEVIDSLAAVVRELIENSLDAAATRISVSLWPERWRVMVVDNGAGMSLTNLQKCAQAHNTSKIYTCEDLNYITSLGFRGEALHSLAQLAELEILSRQTADSAAGWRILYQQGMPIQETPAAIAPGTIVTVTNLFGNWLARRQGLPKMTQQLRAVQSLIGQIALCHPHVTWQVWQNERLWFQISPGSLEQILPQILSSVRTSDLHGVEAAIASKEESHPKKPGRIALVLGLPDRCHRRRADWVRVAVNGRMVRLPELEQATIGAFAKTLPRDRYPVCFLHLKICPSQIDWNRHPAKTEIYLHSIQYWQEQIAQAIGNALRISPAHLPATLQNRRVGKLLQASEEKGAYRLNRLPPNPAPANRSLSLIELRAVAQVNKTYIVVEHPSGLWLVEQHIAHERVLYEQLQDDWLLVPLDTPIILKNLTSAQLEQLQQLGIEIELFGEQLWAARNVPAMLQERDDCADALIELSFGDLQAAQVATACRSAIRNGTPLDLPQMQGLLNEWQNTRNPRTCPHGRPIYLSLEETSLARFFRRHWVIGKSHGI